MKTLQAAKRSAIRLIVAALLCVAAAPTPAQAICGDGIPERIEECDDGNTADGDCCSANCTLDPGQSPCDDDGNQCTDDFCNGEGTCNHFPREGSCDDGNSCTIADFCNPNGFCDNDGVLEDGSGCSDDALCGSVGTCGGGVCLGDPASCDGFGDVCHSAVCDPQLGKCEVLPLADGTVCDQPSVCTDPGQCQSGECIQPQIDCSHLDDACHVGVCDLEFQGCFASPKPNDTPCDDTNGCTDPGVCDDGECLTTPKDCSAFADQCNDAGCDQKSPSGCFSTPKADGGKCNDGDNCTALDECTAGVCGGAPVDCSGLSDSCHVGTCDGETGECLADPLPDGTGCNDDNPCTETDQCGSGECSGQLVDCSASGDACNTGICNSRTGQCETVPNEGPSACDDGDPCTTGDQCQAGLCVGSPKDCSGADGACLTGTCNPQDGQCQGLPVEDGIACNDENPCTNADQCAGGVCAGSDVDCSGSGGSCVIGSCNTETGKCEGTPSPDGSECNDNDRCTTADQCNSGECGGNPIDCSSSDDACNAGECNGETGECRALPREDGTPCDDGLACTISDQCTGGLCGGSPKDCSTGDGECSTGACNENTGECVATPGANGAPCNDDAFCTSTDTCQNGLCVGSGDPCASGESVCVRSCNEETDSCNASAGTPCESDDNVCTDDVCDGEGSCQGLANTDACDDSLFCTTNDRCDDTECIGDPTCPTTGVCENTCNEEEDACLSCGKPFSSTRCVVNAVFVLQGALGLRDCDLCTCDVNSSGTVTASDALMILRTCTNLPTALECPIPSESTTTTVPTTTTTFAQL